MLQNRPVLTIKRTPFEKFLDVLAVLLFIGNVIYIFMEWSSLPSQIPIHFNGVGEVDGWGSKNMIWFLPVVGSFLWSGLTILEKYPHLYNYINLTEDNVERQYKNARLLVNVVKNLMLALFVYLNWESIQVAYGKESELGIWFLPLALIITLGPVVFFIVRSFRLR